MGKINEILNSLNEKKSTLTEQMNSLDAENDAEVIKTIKDELGSVEMQLSAFEEIDKNNKQLYSRAKRAEGFEEVNGKWVKKEKEASKTEASSQENYSLAEIRALAKIHDDDVDRVTRFAKAEKVSVDAALKDPDLQAILKVRDEQRRTAQAANVGATSAGSSKISERRLLSDFEAGKIPDDDEGLQRLAEARMAARKAKK